MKKEVIFDQFSRGIATGKESTRDRHFIHATLTSGEGIVGMAAMISHLTQRIFRQVRAGAIGILAVAAAIACTPLYQEAHEVDARPPKVSYDFSSDAGLIEANSKARTYCGQYAATPSLQGTITKNSDGGQTVTFECIKTVAATPYPPPSPPPMSYSYRTDTELLQAIESADAYCARSGQTASSSIVTNPGGTRTLTYQCIPR